MLYTTLVTQLETRLRAELPGERAHEPLAPRPRREWPPGFNRADVRHAAGLLLIFPIEGRAHIVLTVRSDALRHPGQVSLPGGVVEAGESLEQTALREAHEEIALPRAGVRVLATLTPLDIPVSGFRLHPIVAVCDRRPQLHPADGEVAGVLEVDIDELIAPGQPRMSQADTAGALRAIPAFHIQGREIWGATAMVLAEFLALLDWIPPASL